MFRLQNIFSNLYTLSHIIFENTQTGGQPPEYMPTTSEDKISYKKLMSGNKLVVNGVANHLVNETRDFVEQKRYAVFYFANRIDNLNYLLSEIVQLQQLNNDCYFAVALSQQQYQDYYYLKTRYPQLNELNTIVDKHGAGNVFIEEGHTHVVFYQQMDEESIINHLMELNELLSQQDVEMDRAKQLEGYADFVQKDNNVTFQGVDFLRIIDNENIDPDEDNQCEGKMKVQGHVALCLLRNTFDFDEQLYQFYQLTGKVNMNFMVCFVGTTDKEMREISQKLTILNEINLLKDSSKKGAEILHKSNAIIRFYLINKEGQIYNTADDVKILSQLLQNEFREKFYTQTEEGGFIDVTQPTHLTYEGRIYKYLNKHQQFNAKASNHLTLIFTRLPPVSKIANYDEFKVWLSKITEMEKNYPGNVCVLCLLGLNEEDVKQINVATGCFKRVQMVLDNNTKIQRVWQKGGHISRGKLVMEVHTFDEELKPILNAEMKTTEKVFTVFEEAELYLHDADYRLTDTMPNVVDPIRKDATIKPKDLE
ncbi:Conserved_hypothetical protein [Hexamita inflata]|uniref:Uncharacterized protein n=1 Tax=Hexamita inflata TaxID=28002 RepID=A0ABP1HF94_9EUKA